MPTTCTEGESTMNLINDADEMLLKQNANLIVTNENQNDLLIGYRARITALETEAEAWEYNDLQLQEAQKEIFRLRKELGR